MFHFLRHSLHSRLTQGGGGAARGVIAAPGGSCVLEGERERELEQWRRERLGGGSEGAALRLC